MKTKHLLGECWMCGPFVQCATCGNNCCNAGYGKVNGVTCLDCPDAYEIQDIYCKDSSAIEFSGQGKIIPRPDFIEYTGS